MFDVATVLLFVAALLAPLVDAWVLRPDLDRSVQAEYRQPAPRPKTPRTARALKNYPGRFESWYRDTFGLRDHLLELHAQLMWYGFGLSPTDVVVRGKSTAGQPWIFFEGDRVLETQRGDARFTEQDLVGWQRMFESRSDWCAARGIEYLSVVVPNKAEIYPEYLPGGNPSGESRLDQLGEHLREHSQMRFLDLKPALLAAKSTDRVEEGDYLYRPLGTHWTDRGAHAGLEAMFGAVEDVLPDLQARPRESFQFQRGPRDAGDFWGSRLYLDTLDKRDDWALVDPDRALTRSDGPKGSRTVVMKREVPSSSAARRVFVLHDSFGTQLREVLAERFAASKFVWDYRFDPAAIEDFAPDLVIDLRVERALVFQAPELAPGADQESVQRDFEASERILWRSAGTSGLRLWKRGSLELESAGELPRSGFVLDAAGPGTGLLLPELDVPQNANIALRVEYESPLPGYSFLVYRTERDPFMNPRKSWMVPVREGRNVLYFEVMSSRVEGRTLLRLLDSKGRFIVHSIEARALSWRR